MGVTDRHAVRQSVCERVREEETLRASQGESVKELARERVRK